MPLTSPPSATSPFVHEDLLQIERLRQHAGYCRAQRPWSNRLDEGAKSPTRVPRADEHVETRKACPLEPRTSRSHDQGLQGLTGSMAKAAAGAGVRSGLYGGRAVPKWST